MGKLLVIIGLILIVVGILMAYNIRIPFLGRLPGDIYIQGENYQFYFPIVTCLVISAILSFIFYLWTVLNR